MTSTRPIVAIGLWATTIWGFAGVVLTREVVAGSRAADVIAASPLCVEGCPPLAGGGSTWVAVAVLSAWIVVALGSLAALVVLLLAQRGMQEQS